MYMHRMHNMYLKSLQDKKMCNQYIEELLKCYKDNKFSIEKEKMIIDKMNFYCNQNYNSFSKSAICSSVNSCGVTLK